MLYVAEGIRICTENTANFGGGSMLTMKFSDILHPEDKKKQKTSKQVITQIKNKLGG